MLKITGLEVDKYKSENTLLKKKLIELSKDNSKESTKNDIEDLLNESDDDLDLVETIPVDVKRLKNVLYNRLKSSCKSY